MHSGFQAMVAKQTNKLFVTACNITWSWVQLGDQQTYGIIFQKKATKIFTQPNGVYSPRERWAHGNSKSHPFHWGRLLVLRTCSNFQTQKHVLKEVQFPVEILRSKNRKVEIWLLQKAIQETPKFLCNFHFTTLTPWRLLAGLVTELTTSSEHFLHDSLSIYL